MNKPHMANVIRRWPGLCCVHHHGGTDEPEDAVLATVRALERFDHTVLVTLNNHGHYYGDTEPTLRFLTRDARGELFAWGAVFERTAWGAWDSELTEAVPVDDAAAFILQCVPRFSHGVSVRPAVPETGNDDLGLAWTIGNMRYELGASHGTVTVHPAFLEAYVRSVAAVTDSIIH